MLAGLEDGEVHLWWTSTRISPGMAPTLQVLLSDDERAKAARFVRQADRNRYVAAHAMLRLVLSRYVDVAPGELGFEVGDQGKPRLEAAPDYPLSFNLSHSGKLALVAVSGAPAVGVDLEEIRDDVDVPALASSVLSAAELRVLHAAPLERQRRLFFRSWVRKEAVLKGCGLGLTVEPQRVVALTEETKGDSGFVAVKLSSGSAEWGVRDLEIGDRYAGAVAAPGQGWTLRRFEHRWPAITRSPVSPSPGRPG